MIALLILLLLSPLHLSGQPKHLYTSIRGGSGLQVSPRGTYLISTSALSRHSYVRVETKEEMFDLPDRAYKGSVDVLTDSLVLIDREYILDLTKREMIDTLGLRWFRSSVVVSSDRQLAAQITDSGDVAVWRIHDRMMLYGRRHHSCNVVAFSSDGAYLMISDKPASATQRSWRMPLVVVKMSDTSWTRTLSDQDVDACLSSDGRVMYTTTRSGKINQWDLTTGSVVRTSPEFYSVVTGSLQVGVFTLDVAERTLLIAGTKTALFDVESLNVRAVYDASVIRVSQDRDQAIISRSTGETRRVELATAKVIDSLNLTPIAGRLIRNVACTDDLRLMYKAGAFDVLRYDRGTLDSNWRLAPVGVRLWIPMLPVDEYLVYPDWKVLTASTGELKYDIMELFNLAPPPEALAYDEDSHLYVTADDSRKPIPDAIILDPTDSSRCVIRTTPASYNLAGHGDILFGYRENQDLTAYSTRDGKVLWSGVADHIIRTDTNVIVGDRWLIVKGELEWYVINSMTGNVVDTLPLSLVPNVVNPLEPNVRFADQLGVILFVNQSFVGPYRYTCLLRSVQDRVTYDTLGQISYLSLLGGVALFINDSANGEWFYDLRSRSRISHIPGGRNTIRSVALSGNVLVVDYNSDRVVFFEFSTGRELFVIDDRSILGSGAMTYDDSNKLLLFNDSDALTMYDLSGAVVSSVDPSGYQNIRAPQISIQIVPNPFVTSTVVNVRFVSSEDQQLQVIDLSGRVLHTFVGNGTLNVQQYSLDETGLPNGIYFVRASDHLGSHTSTLAH